MHTPGPWRIENDSDDYLRVLAEGVQYPVADLGTVNANDYPPETIATLWADAHLIEAAPDMLAALQGVLAFWDKFVPKTRHDQYPECEDAEFNEFQKVRAAIAKATVSSAYRGNER